MRLAASQLHNSPTAFRFYLGAFSYGVCFFANFSAEDVILSPKPSIFDKLTAPADSKRQHLAAMKIERFLKENFEKLQKESTQRKQSILAQKKMYQSKLLENAYVDPTKFIFNGPATFESPSNAKSLTVALMGLPNAGKSTLLNKFIKVKISAVSSKPQTTRMPVLGVYTEEPTQIVFVDSPGIPHKDQKSRGPGHIAKAGFMAPLIADHILYVADLTRTSFEADFHLLANIRRKNPETPVTLLLNKVDASNDDVAQRVMKSFVQKFDFLKSKMAIAARHSKNVEYLKTHLCSLATAGPWRFHPDVHSLQSDVEKLLECVREQFFRRLNDEIPYVLSFVSKNWAEASSYPFNYRLF